MISLKNKQTLYLLQDSGLASLIKEVKHNIKAEKDFIKFATDLLYLCYRNNYKTPVKSGVMFHWIDDECFIFASVRQVGNYYKWVNYKSSNSAFVDCVIRKTLRTAPKEIEKLIMKKAEE